MTYSLFHYHFIITIFELLSLDILLVTLRSKQNCPETTNPPIQLSCRLSQQNIQTPFAILAMDMADPTAVGFLQVTNDTMSRTFQNLNTGHISNKDYVQNLPLRVTTLLSLLATLFSLFATPLVESLYKTITR